MTEPNENPKPAPIPPEVTHTAEIAALAEPAHAEQPTPIPRPPPPATAPRGHEVIATPIWLTILVVVVLVGGLAWIYTNPAPSPVPAEVVALEQALRSTQARLAALEQRPLPTTDLAPLTNRLTALETRFAALEQRPAAAAPDVSGPISTATAALNGKMAELDAKLQQVASQDAARAATAARLRAAAAALEAGQKLGDLPGAPTALSRFAQTPAPTEPALRLSFPTAASAAEAASKPSAEGYNFAERMWRRVQTLVTVRQGAKVLIGAPAAVTLNAARGKLDAGDLAGAVAALAPLDGPAAAAMAPWRGEAQSLLDARAALASLGARS